MSYSSTILATAGLTNYYRLNDVNSGTSLSGTSVNLGGGYLAMPNRTLSSPVTLEFFFKPSSVANDDRIFSGTVTAACRFNNAAIEIYNGTSWQPLTANNFFVTGKWYLVHLILESNGTVTLYIWGRKVSNTAPSLGSFVFLTEALSWGQKFAGSFGNSFSGNFKSIAYYSSSLSQSQILLNIQAIGNNNFNSIVEAIGSIDSHWRLDETSGTTIIDSVGAHNGTYTGTVTLNQSSVPIGYGSAADSKGSNMGTYSDNTLTLDTSDNPAPIITDHV